MMNNETTVLRMMTKTNIKLHITYKYQGSVSARMKSQSIYSVLTNRLHNVTRC